jgi:hypothetical protein
MAVFDAFWRGDMQNLHNVNGAFAQKAIGRCNQGLLVDHTYPSDREADLEGTV